jgi:hypothetical protein
MLRFSATPHQRISDPAFDALRGDSRYAGLLHRIRF